MDVIRTSMSNLAGFMSRCDDGRGRIGKIITQLHNIAHLLVDIGWFDEAIACFEVLSLGDDSYECGEFAYGLGRAHEGKGDHEAALDWYRIAYENNPEVPEFAAGIARITDRMHKAGKTTDDGYRPGDFSFFRGQQYENAGDPERALVWYRAALQHGPAVEDFVAAQERAASLIALRKE